MHSSTYHAAWCSLARCFERQSGRFANLFSPGIHSGREYGIDLAPLADLEILQLFGHDVNVLAPIVAFRGLFIKCDPPDLNTWDRVFPVHEDESALLARWVLVRPSDVVLDVGTGSGIVALVAAAAGARKVIATDINSKVRDYFTFNAHLNGLTGRVEYIESDLLASFEGERFDVNTCNPPFVPVPPEAPYFLHSDGGPFGTDILERLFRDFTCYLRPNGQLFVMALSLSKRPSRITALFPDARLTRIYGSDGASLAELLASFAAMEGYEQWRDRVLALYNTIEYFAVSWGDQDAPKRLSSLIGERARECVCSAWSKFSWSMQARWQRYRVAGCKSE